MSASDDERSLSRNRDFMVLWSGQLLSALGTSMSVLAFPLVTFGVTGSARLAGAVGGASALGRFVAGLLAGGVADRTSRRSLILGGNLAGVALFASLAVAGILHHLTLTHLLVVAVGSGVVGAFITPALSAAVRGVVPASQRATASAYSNGRTQAASLVGPPAGGALIGFGYGAPFLVDAISYLAACVSVLLVKAPLDAPQRPRKHLLREIGDGFTFLAKRTSLAGFCVWAAVFNFGVWMVWTTTVLRLTSAHVSSARIGLVESISALGGLLGAMLAVKTVNRFPTGAFTITTALVMGVVLMATGATTSPWVIGALLAVGMCLMPATNAGISGYFSHIVPNGYQGRFNGATGLIIGVLSPLAPLAAGQLVAAADGATAVATGSVLVLASCLPLILIPELRGLPTPATWSTWEPIPTNP